MFWFIWVHPLITFTLVLIALGVICSTLEFLGGVVVFIVVCFKPDFFKPEPKPKPEPVKVPVKVDLNGILSTTEFNGLVAFEQRQVLQKALKGNRGSSVFFAVRSLRKPQRELVFEQLAWSGKDKALAALELVKNI